MWGSAPIDAVTGCADDGDHVVRVSVGRHGGAGVRGDEAETHRRCLATDHRRVVVAAGHRDLRDLASSDDVRSVADVDLHRRWHPGCAGGRGGAGHRRAVHVAQESVPESHLHLRGDAARRGRGDARPEPLSVRERTDDPEGPHTGGGGPNVGSGRRGRARPRGRRRGARVAVDACADHLRVGQGRPEPSRDRGGNGVLGARRAAGEEQEGGARKEARSEKNTCASAAGRRADDLSKK